MTKSPNRLPALWARLSVATALLAASGSLVGPLFLVWVAVLGLSVFAAAGAFAALDVPGMQTRTAGIRVHLPGWFLIAVAVMFALLWLSAIVPDLLAGRPSTSATTWDVPTDPVHVLDLAVFVPAVCASGVLLLRRHRIGYDSAPGLLIFLALTCLPILVIPFVAQTRGDAPGWAVMVPISIIAAATLIVPLATDPWNETSSHRDPKRALVISPAKNGREASLSPTPPGPAPACLPAQNSCRRSGLT